MLSHTHAVGGFALVYLLHKAGYVHPSMADYIVASSAALLPDVDHSSSFLGKRTKIFTIFKHRGFTHSLFGGFVLYGILYLIQQYLYKPIGPYTLYIMLGFASHIILDILNPMGVKLFYPFGLNVKIPLIKTGSKLETIFAFAIIATMGYSYFKK